MTATGREEADLLIRIDEESKEQQLRTPLLEGSNNVRRVISNLLVHVILRYIVARE
jgi:hypothetical protein